MQFLLVLMIAGFSLVKCQDQCGNTSSCLYPPSSACLKVTIDPTGLDPTKSPYYRTALSNVTGSQEFDNHCITLFDLGDGLFFVVENMVTTNGSTSMTMSLRGDISGSPGAYRYEGKDPGTECGSCVANDYLVRALDGACEGVYLVYRCPIYGECVDDYAGQEIVYVESSACLASPVPPCCQSTAASAAQVRGLSPPLPFPLNLPFQCVTRYNGLTAVNADCVPEEYSVEIDDLC